MASVTRRANNPSNGPSPGATGLGKMVGVSVAMVATTESIIRPGRYLADLPGPDRKRRPAEYSFRLKYRADDPAAVGCLASWEVTGGRTVYQIDLEQTVGGWRHWHCTCADAVFRAGPHGQVCKHVLGLRAFGWPLTELPASV